MDRFIVGTGRCGSTLLSRMMAEHPAVLSLFEFFNGLDFARRFSREPVVGKDFAALIAAEQPVVSAVLRRGYAVAEICYPFGSRSRYQREDPLPWILVGMLPRLSDDPDALFDEVMAFASDLPPQEMVQHHRALFDWLVKRLDRECWIERSGSSVDYLATLHEFFPTARFCHLHRDGREVALSMRDHHAYRLPISMLYQAQGDAGVPTVNFATIDFGAPPDPADPISKILASRPPVEVFGRYWSDQLAHGFAAMPALAADQLLHVAFEELITEPRQVLRQIGEFFELDPGRNGWIDRAAGLVRRIPPTRFDKLSAPEQASLSQACRTGTQLLGREI
ncbi:MAG: sulfotransferase [Myxococcota bacterium]